MSEPKRYTHKHLYGSDGYINESLFSDEKYCVAPEGEYVLHSDYARLKAEVERLRKAGDAMYEELGNFGMTWTFREAWNAAKEGKPSV